MENNKSSKERPGLKAARKRVKKTQEDVARELDTTVKAVWAWENSGAIPSFDKAVKLAEILELSLRDLAVEFGLDVSNIPSEGGDRLLPN